MHFYKLISVLILAIVCGGYAVPLTFTTIITGESPVAKENLAPKSKLSAEIDNVDSFDVHPANRWDSSTSGSITSNITDGNLLVDAAESSSYKMDRQLFEPDSEVEYRYGVDYYNDSAIATVDGAFDKFNDEWFDDTFGDISDWSEGDYEGWVSNDTLSLFGDHYLKILNDDGTYYYKTFESLFDGHLPDPRSTPFGGVLTPKADLDDNDGGTVNGMTFTIPEGQEWLLSYIAFNIGQYDGVFPCTSIGWCVDNDSSLYEYETDLTYDAYTTIRADLPTVGQLFTIPYGEVWNISNTGTWFYYTSAFGQDFFVYDSYTADGIDFSEWDFETLDAYYFQGYGTDEQRLGGVGSQVWQWAIYDSDTNHMSQIFEVPYGEVWYIDAIGFEEVVAANGATGIIGITATVLGQAYETGTSDLISSLIPDWSNIYTSTTTSDEPNAPFSYAPYSWTVPRSILTEGHYAFFMNGTNANRYYVRGTGNNISNSLDFYTSNSPQKLFVENSAYEWDVYTTINYTLRFSSEWTLPVDVRRTLDDGADDYEWEIRGGADSNNRHSVLQTFIVPVNELWEITAVGFDEVSTWSETGLTGIIGIVGTQDGTVYEWTTDNPATRLVPNWDLIYASAITGEEPEAYPTYGFFSWSVTPFFLTTGTYMWFWNNTASGSQEYDLYGSQIGNNDTYEKLDYYSFGSTEKWYVEDAGSAFSVWDLYTSINYTTKTHLQEYFTELGDVADFLEDIEGFTGDSVIQTNDCFGSNGCLGVQDGGVDGILWFETPTANTIPADIYQYITFRFKGLSVGYIDNISIYDSEMNEILFDNSTSWSDNEWFTVTYELIGDTCKYAICDSGNWNGTEDLLNITMRTSKVGQAIAIDYVYLHSDEGWYDIILDRRTTDPNGNSGGFLNAYLSSYYESEMVYALNRPDTSINGVNLCTSGWVSSCWDSISQLFIVPDGQEWTIREVGYLNVSSNGSPTGIIGITGIKVEALGGGGTGYVPDFSNIYTSIITGDLYDNGSDIGSNPNGGENYWIVPKATLTAGLYAWFWNATNGAANRYQLGMDTVSAATNRTRDYITLVITGSTQFYPTATGDFFPAIKFNSLEDSVFFYNEGVDLYLDYSTIEFNNERFADIFVIPEGQEWVVRYLEANLTSTGTFPSNEGEIGIYNVEWCDFTDSPSCLGVAEGYVGDWADPVVNTFFGAVEQNNTFQRFTVTPTILTSGIYAFQIRDLVEDADNFYTFAADNDGDNRSRSLLGGWGSGWAIFTTGRNWGYKIIYTEDGLVNIWNPFITWDAGAVSESYWINADIYKNLTFDILAVNSFDGYNENNNKSDIDYSNPIDAYNTDFTLAYEKISAYYSNASFQCFTKGISANTLVSIGVHILRSVTLPSGNIHLDLYETTGTYGTDCIPSGDPIATSDLRDISTLPTFNDPQIPILFNFSAYQLTSQYYAFSINYSDGDINRWIRNYFNDTTPAHSGNYGLWDGASWIDNSSRDMWFEVYHNTGNIIENMTIYDFEYNFLCFTNFSSTILVNGTWYEVFCNLGDSANWQGREKGIRIEFGLQVSLDNLGDELWFDNIEILGTEQVEASIGVVGLDGSNFPDWSDIRGYLDLTEDNMTKTPNTYMEYDFGADWFLLETGTYAWFLNYTNPIPSPSTSAYQLNIAINFPDAGFTDISYSNTTGWSIETSLDFMPIINYTLLYDDFTPRGEIGIAGLYDWGGDFDTFDKSNIYWNMSIGNLENNNSWNYFSFGKQLVLSAGTYLQYINTQGNFTDCTDYLCSGADPRRSYSNGYILYSDYPSPEQTGLNSATDEREGIWHQGRYVLYSPSPSIHRYYWGVNYTDIYCPSICESVEYFSMEELDILNFEDGTEEGFTTSSGTAVNYNNEYLYAHPVANPFTLTKTSLSIDTTDLYDDFSIRFFARDVIFDITITDGTNTVCFDSAPSGGIGWITYSCNPSLDADWTGVETTIGIIFDFVSYTADDLILVDWINITRSKAITSEIFADYFDIGLGDIANFADGTIENFVVVDWEGIGEPSGYYELSNSFNQYLKVDSVAPDPVEGIYYYNLSKDSLSIDTSIYSVLSFEWNSSDDGYWGNIDNIEIFADGLSVCIDETNKTTDGTWHDFSCDLSLSGNWVGSISELTIKMQLGTGSMHNSWMLFDNFVLDTVTDGFFYVNGRYPLIEEFSKDVYQPKWETSVVTNTSDFDLVDSMYSTFRIPEYETWEISSLSLYGQMVGSASATWYLTQLKQCVWGSTCNPDIYSGLYEAAWIPDMNTILATGNATEFTTSIAWQNITLDHPLTLSKGAYAIIFLDTSIDDDGNYYHLYSDLDYNAGAGINVTQTGFHNTSMSWEWSIEQADSSGSFDGKDLRFQIHYNNTEVNAEAYNILRVFFNSSQVISNILINDYDGNQVCSDSTGWSVGVWYDWQCDLSEDSDWGSLEHGLQFNFTTAVTSNIQLTNITLYSNFVQISQLGQSITAGSSGYFKPLVRFNTSTMLSNVDWIDSDGNNACPTYNFEPDYRHEWKCQLYTGGSSWIGTETEINFKLTFNITEPSETDYVLVDYFMLFDWLTTLPIEYFADDYQYGNAMNFNDGTTEGITELGTAVLSNYNNESLQVDDVTNNIWLQIDTPLMSGVVWDWLFIRVYSTSEITQTRIIDKDTSNTVCINSTNLLADQWNIWSCDLDIDPDWDSSEVGFDVEFQFLFTLTSVTYIDYIVLDTNNRMHYWDIGGWETWIYGELEQMTDLVPIPNGTSSFMRFYLYPENKNRQLLAQNFGSGLETDYHSLFYTLYLDNISVDSGINSFQVGFYSNTTGMNWVDFNTTQFDNNLTDVYAFNDLNTTARDISVPLWNVTGWSGTIQAIYVNITDFNTEQHFDMENILLKIETWTHNPDVIFGFWDKTEDQKLTQVKHSIMSYWTDNASFRYEVELYDIDLNIASYFHSELIYFDPLSTVTIYYRVIWKYNLQESQFEIEVLDDGGDDLFEGEFGTDFITVDPNPKLFDTRGIMPSLYYLVSTGVDEPATAYVDFILATFKTKEWTQTTTPVNASTWVYESAFTSTVETNSTHGQCVGVACSDSTEWSLTVGDLDSVSAVLSNWYFHNETAGSPPTGWNIFSTAFSLKNVNAVTGALLDVFTIGTANGLATIPQTTVSNYNGLLYTSYAPPYTSYESTWQGAEFSITTRNDREFVDLRLRAYRNQSAPEIFTDFYASTNLTNISVNWSQEYVIQIHHGTYEMWDTYTTFKSQVSEFAFVTKGFFEDPVGTILSPLLDIIGGLLEALWNIFVAIFTPLIMFLAWILNLALSVLGTVFQVAIAALGVILDGLGTILDSLLGVIGEILTAIGEIIGEIAVILLEFAEELLDFFLTDVLPWLILQMLFIWETIAEGVFNIIDPSGGISDFFAGLFANNATELFDTVFGLITLFSGIVTLIWIGLTFYLFTSPAFQAEGDANRFASEFMSNAFSFHGVYFSILGFNIPIFLPTIVYWLIMTILLGYLDWVLGGIVLF